MDVEQAVIAIWSEVLARPVAATDDFFELGGDSISVTHVTDRVCELLGFDIQPALLYQVPRLREYVGELARLKGA